MSAALEILKFQPNVNLGQNSAKFWYVIILHVAVWAAIKIWKIWAKSLI